MPLGPGVALALPDGSALAMTIAVFAELTCRCHVQEPSDALRRLPSILAGNIQAMSHA